MKKWAFNAMAAGALTLFLTTSVLWMRSYFVQDSLDWGREVDRPDYDEERSTSVISECGGVNVAHEWVIASGASDPLKSFPVHKVRVVPWLTRSVPLKYSRYDAHRYPTDEPTTLGISWKRDKLDETFPNNRGQPIRLQLSQLTLVFPYWILWLISIPPLIPLVMRSRRRFRGWMFKRAGRCPSCGYDRRASPNLCPECGRPKTAIASRRLRQSFFAISGRPRRAAFFMGER